MKFLPDISSGFVNVISCLGILHVDLLSTRDEKKLTSALQNFRRRCFT